MKHTLSIELVPTTAWFKNVRSEVTPKRWDILRRACYSAASYRCEICGGRGKKWPVECHEVWDYNDKIHVQKLIRLIALCPACHRVKHIGREQATGHGERSLKHLMKVNNWSRAFANSYIQQQYEKWNQRSEHDWELDLSWLEKRVDKVPG